MAPSWRQSRLAAPSAAHQLLQREHRLGIGEIAGDRRDALARHRASAGRPRRRTPRANRRSPACRRAAHRAGRAGARRSPSTAKRVLSEIHSSFTSSLRRGRTRSTCAPRASTRMLLPTASSTSTDSVLRSSHEPRDEGIGLGGQRADRAQIDDVGRQLGGQRALDIGADLHVLAAAGGAQFLDPGDLGQEADAARAMDAAGHAGLDQRPEILVASPRACSPG